MLDKLLDDAELCGIQIREHNFKSLRLKGLYTDSVITLNKAAISTTAELTCVLAEELGHHFKSAGNILDQKDISNRKQELRGREWGYGYLIPLESFINAHKYGVRNRYELAEYLNVTEEYLDEAIKRYEEKYGLYVPVGKYTVCFSPFGVIELFDL
ncbi:ImmA/IrrE family metallo-endopeptidase [Paenibacillus aquistagni]|uniref:IrrE N-terminal-like domain-containing protein n=1 Tax=Paenibacillus aquistagni TaxID=1852522 RepID=A0A1X7LYP3_9BACL|nr:ImmA/IrrE family metallo-endopeptidase [Paenibacillus aquistagni]SMG58362.1 protein of unknown function [Paenibacillus aquistagni]